MAHSPQPLFGTAMPDIMQDVENADLFGQVVFHLPEGVWVRAAGSTRMMYVNPAMQAFTGGVARAGSDVQDLFELAHPNDRARLHQEFADRPYGGFEQDCRIRSGDGSYRWVSLRSVALRDHRGVVHRVAGLMTDIHERKMAEQQLMQLAHHDPLTGLANRTLFGKTLDDNLELARLWNAQVTVIFLDLDGFKHVNDTLGHAQGDVLLQQVAKRLKTVFKDASRYTLGRLGGDEFGLLVWTGPSPSHPTGPVVPVCADPVPDVPDFDPVALGPNPISHIALVPTEEGVSIRAATPQHVVADSPQLIQDIERCASRLLSSLTPPFFIDGKPISISASAGLARFPHDAQTAATLMRYADTAMYEAKSAGRKIYAFYHDGMDQKIHEKRDLEQSLKKAVDNNEFVLYYQPKVDMRTKAWVGVEALVRWERPGIGAILPAMFMSTLEETGLIVPLGAWVINEACRQMEQWHHSGLPSVRVAVNVSAHQFEPPASPPGHPDMNLFDVVARAQKAYPNAFLDLELTESTLMSKAEQAAEVMRRLERLGVRWSIDDFGTGYSSLAYLKRFPLKTLKIDRSFVHDITGNPEDAAIVAAIVEMAHSLKLEVVAEGVETAEQMGLLSGLRIDQAQGYFTTKPLCALDMEIWLRSHPSLDPSTRPLAMVDKNTTHDRDRV